MYSIRLDDNTYFTGAYAEIGSVIGGIDVPSLPPDMTKATCYKYDGEHWIFDGDKYVQLEKEQATVNIREQRKAVFTDIDRYQLILVYESLTPEQQEELAEYRQAWLSAPETLVIPEKPEWMV